MSLRYRHIFVLLLLIAGRISAQESLLLTTVEPLRSADSLMCRFASPNLLSGRVGKTLLSGLPVLVELRFRLNSESRQLEMLEKYRLSYDIWEDRYSVETSRRKHSFDSLEALHTYWNPKLASALFPLKQLAGQNNFTLELRLRVVLLGRSQGEKLRDWILNPDEMEDNDPSLNRDTGFTLNLNRLVSYFFSRDDIAETFEASWQSGVFILDEVKTGD